VAQVLSGADKTVKKISGPATLTAVEEAEAAREKDVVDVEP
jgi:hypothetical protein